MHEGFKKYIDWTVSEYKKTKDSAYNRALVTFYASVLQDPKFETERWYCENKLQESKDPYVQGFCAAFFNS